MNRRTLLSWVLLILVGAALGWGVRGCGSADRVQSGDAERVLHSGEGAHSAEASAVEWTCSMHPQIRLPEFGACPLCGMDLVPVDAGSADTDPSVVTLSETARKLASVRTSVVRSAPAEREIRLTGILKADETRERQIAAWISGRVERLYVDYTGRSVLAGHPMLDLYSPELLSAQQEFVQAVRANRSTGVGAAGPGAEVLARTEAAAREKLRLLGLTPSQIEEIAKRGEARAVVTITAPLSGVVLSKMVQLGQTVMAGETLYEVADLSRLWLELEAYESDLPWISKGDPITFQTDAFPGEDFEGTVSFVEPMANEGTRTVRVRVEVDNARERLKPAMFARATLRSRVASGPDDPLVIPATAPLLTGTRAVVYVAVDGEEGTFQAREVVLGPKAGDVYVVRDGLAAGERVVSRGAFKIDSELQIRAGESMMSRDPSASSSSEPVRVLSVSNDFRRSLDAFFDDYFQLTEALSKDDLEGARTAWARSVEAAESIDGSGLAPEAYSHWQDARREVARLGASAPADLDRLRTSFRSLSDVSIELTRRFGAAGADSAYIYHCPMAFSNAGADWLQRRRGVENPYYGASMFRCGSETEAFIRAQGGGTR